MSRKRYLLSLVLIIGILCAIWSAPAQAQGGALSDLLRQAPDNDAARRIVWFSSLGALKRALNIQVKSREALDRMPMMRRATYLSEVGRLVYFSEQSGLARAPEWLATFGINSFAIERELVVGEAPDQVAILEGAFDANSIGGALQSLGYQAQAINGTPIFALGDDNRAPAGAVGSLAADKMNRIALLPNRLIAAASTASLTAALAPAPSLADNPIYAALANGLEMHNTLICAVLFDGAFAARKLVGNAPSAPSGLPAYQAGAIGYSRSGKARILTIALAYADPGAAERAAKVLIERLGSYISPNQPERPLFANWEFSVEVAQVGGVTLLKASANMPKDSDVAWVALVQARDLGFLRPQ
ncbi:MAG: hypothetical protein J7551_10525 [Chloroflexi bacterium]|jgi:hypothetical protein|nr:hypothetical protein [Chloroflexota bacterium]